VPQPVSYSAQAWVAAIAFAIIAIVAVVFLIDVFLVEARINAAVAQLSGIWKLIMAGINGG
jgi:hypothetical protein